MNFVRWILDHFGENKFLVGKWAPRKWWNEGWIEGDDPNLFTNRPDPLLLTPAERRAEIRRQIQEDIKL